jgi:hypothetical protein
VDREAFADMRAAAERFPPPTAHAVGGKATLTSLWQSAECLAWLRHCLEGGPGPCSRWSARYEHWPAGLGTICPYGAVSDRLPLASRLTVRPP